MYNSFIQPYFDYCSNVWEGLDSERALKLQKLQNRSARMTTVSRLTLPLQPPTGRASLRQAFLVLSEKMVIFTFGLFGRDPLPPSWKFRNCGHPPTSTADRLLPNISNWCVSIRLFYHPSIGVFRSVYCQEYFCNGQRNRFAQICSWQICGNMRKRRS